MYPSDTLLKIMSPQEQMKKKVKDAVKLALKNNIKFDEIKELIDECGNAANIEKGK